MKFIPYLLVAALLAGTVLSCKKNKGPAIPDVSDFSLVDSATFLPRGRGTVTVNAPKLADGKYTMYYFMFPDGFVEPATNRIPAKATLVMTNHTGTFLTEPLDTSFYMIIQTDSIVNAAGGGISVNRLATLVDSTGIMVMQTNGVEMFRTPAVTAKYNGGWIELQAYSPLPGSFGRYSFVDLSLSNIAGVQSISGVGQGGYGVFTLSTTAFRHFANGQITINTLAPLFTGSFSVTGDDSTKMSATFSCPAP